MELIEKCEVVIGYFNGKFIKILLGVFVFIEFLLCKFVDGGQKKRQNLNKYIFNGRLWYREGEVGMIFIYDLIIVVIQNGFYFLLYSIVIN